MIADELRRQDDVFTDVGELQSKLGRDPSERPAAREARYRAEQVPERETTLGSREMIACLRSEPRGSLQSFVQAPCRRTWPRRPARRISPAFAPG